MRGWRYPTADSPRLRVRDLLNHSTGFVDDNPYGDRQQPISEAEFTRMLRAGVPFNRDARSVVRICQPRLCAAWTHHHQLSPECPMTNISGGTFSGRSGMTSTGFEVRDWPIERRAIGYRWENNRWSEEPTMAHGAYGAMGGVQTSANDYAKWMAFLLSGWPARDEPDTGPVRALDGARDGCKAPTSSRVRQPRRQKWRDRLPAGAGLCDGLCARRTIATSACTLSHGGGYPGYGSHMMLMPDHGVGIFVFTNRTYNGGSGPAWDAAVALHKAGALAGRTLAVSTQLSAAYRAAGAVYRAGDVSAAGGLLAMNFLMDRSVENWRSELAKLQGEVGQCDTAEPDHPDRRAGGDLQLAVRPWPNQRQYAPRADQLRPASRR